MTIPVWLTPRGGKFTESKELYSWIILWNGMSLTILGKFFFVGLSVNCEILRGMALMGPGKENTFPRFWNTAVWRNWVKLFRGMTVPVWFTPRGGKFTERKELSAIRLILWNGMSLIILEKFVGLSVNRETWN